MENMHKPGIYEKYVKRFLDIVLSMCGIIVLSPIMLITALLVRVKLGSPVIFKQERAGLNGRKFVLYKFRSMTNEKDEHGKLLPDEVRLGKFGRTLRGTSLDELPSLLNILRGDISIIGPRPLPTRYLQYYTEEEKHRHDVRPGLTGLAQVNGRNYVSWEDKFKMDLKYVNNVSLINDINIFVSTIGVVIKCENVDTGTFIEHEGKIYRPLDVERKRE